MTDRRPQPLLIVLSGPSGVGKDSVIRRLKELGRVFHYVVSATTRPPRDGEIDGVDYWFLSDADFAALVSTGGFVEHANVYGHSYGVPKQQIADALASGKDVLMRVDVQGARTIRSIVPRAVFVFLAPAAGDNLRARLDARVSEDPGSMARRLEQFEAEMQELENFDYLVFNEEGRLDEAVTTIDAIVRAEHARAVQRVVSIK